MHIARQPGPFGTLERCLEGTPVRWIVLPVQLGLRFWVFFGLPFVSSGLTKWEVFPLLKPVAFAWNGWPALSPAARYQFGEICEFCFNVRVWGSETQPLVQWRLPFPDAMAVLAGLGELVLPSLVLVGLLTRLSALGLVAMTVVIQLVIPTGLSVHASWALALLAVVVVGPGPLSLDRALSRS